MADNLEFVLLLLVKTREWQRSQQKDCASFRRWLTVPHLEQPKKASRSAAAREASETKGSLKRNSVLEHSGQATVRTRMMCVVSQISP